MSNSIKIGLIFRALIALILFASFGHSVSAQEWNQWRGPARDGIVPASSTSVSWPESLGRVWSVETGEGYSSPGSHRGSSRNGDFCSRATLRRCRRGNVVHTGALGTDVLVRDATGLIRLTPGR